MSTHVILGKGPVGSTTARMLAERGETVRVLSRSGGRDADGVTHLAVDAGDAEALRRATAGADVVYNCANPAGYHLWEREWPRMAGALLDAAESAGAVLVTMSCLYGYGPAARVMTEDTPLAAEGAKGRLRAGMWKEALARHEAGRLRVTEARASDFFGPGPTANAVIGERVVPRVLRGKSVSLFGDADAPHSFTFMPDVARTLVRLGTDERAWGRAWHVPSAPALSQREIVAAIARVAGVPMVKIGTMPWWLLINVLGTVQPAMRGFAETRHQWDLPFEMDSSRYTEVFGETATDFDEALAETIAWWQGRIAVAA
ncbi:NAD-dependent epimerase/dehydratase family protein [Phytomonospora endophytica]|uniref:Nucleoside-diphosphate-sugar epimerase n=1 Tax=Phytomonospora endophytica TaxID=714109 RepID=A0A841F9Z2_9ACTN|nr:NAD-dependent epimerase/dehydratase family protein [Phytomonospora endophytica]MBB6034051.1 nucleoside-diphosphate-sugar epimerase [Phytomonospora endophytica]GIG71589.1 NAD-dependent epimerase [Phytomonospora endophytica]